MNQHCKRLDQNISNDCTINFNPFLHSPLLSKNRKQQKFLLLILFELIYNTYKRDNDPSTDQFHREKIQFDRIFPISNLSRLQKSLERFDGTITQRIVPPINHFDFVAETAKNREREGRGGGGGSVAIAAGNMNILAESGTRREGGGKGRGAFVNFKAERFASLKIGETYRSIDPSPPLV